VTRALKAVLIVVSIMRPGEGARQAPQVKPLVEPIMLRWINFCPAFGGVPPVSSLIFGPKSSSGINAIGGMAAMNGI
jgi:hypothetical protein